PGQRVGPTGVGIGWGLGQPGPPLLLGPVVGVAGRFVEDGGHQVPGYGTVPAPVARVDRLTHRRSEPGPGGSRIGAPATPRTPWRSWAGPGGSPARRRSRGRRA